MCSECGAYLATRNSDAALRKKTAEEWSKKYGVQISADDVFCVGCTSPGGPHFRHCSECEIRACGKSKNVANCGRCPDYACGTITGFFGVVPAARTVLDAERKRA